MHFDAITSEPDAKIREILISLLRILVKICISKLTLFLFQCNVSYLSVLKQLLGGDDNRCTVFLISPSGTCFSLLKKITLPVGQ
jgi:hypothetical protein